MLRSDSPQSTLLVRGRRPEGGPRLGHGNCREVGIKAGGWDIVVALRLCTKVAHVGAQSTLLLPPSGWCDLSPCLHHRWQCDHLSGSVEGFHQNVLPEVQLCCVLTNLTCYIWSYFLILSALPLQIYFWTVCFMCLSGTRLSPINSLLQKSRKMTKSECLSSCGISSEPNWCRWLSVHS